MKEETYENIFFISFQIFDSIGMTSHFQKKKKKK